MFIKELGTLNVSYKNLLSYLINAQLGNIRVHFKRNKSSHFRALRPNINLVTKVLNNYGDEISNFASFFSIINNDVQQGSATKSKIWALEFVSMYLLHCVSMN